MASGKRSRGRIEASITRRDFLNSMLLGTGATLLGAAAPVNQAATARARRLLPEPDLGPDWYGYGGIGDYASSHGNTPEVVFRAHSLRDKQYESRDLDVIDTGETYDLVIVGGGLAGLGAALRFAQTKRSGAKALLLDNHPVFGGESKRNEFEVDGYRIAAPQGANGFSVPEADSGGFADGDARYFRELNIRRAYDYADLRTNPRNLKFGQDDYGFLYWLEHDINVGYFFDEKSHGVSPRWVIDPWARDLEGFPVSERLRRQLLEWRNWSTLPYDGDDFGRWLDGMTYKQLLVDQLKLDPAVAAYADPILASSAGGCSSVLSAYSAYALGMPGLDVYYDDFDIGERHSFPGGNDGFARYFVKAIMPDAIEGDGTFEGIITGRIRFDRLDNPRRPFRMRLSSTVLRLAHEGSSEQADFVKLIYAKNRQLYSIRAKAVVMATGSWITKYVVADLPAGHREAMQEFLHTSILVANVAIRQWRFLCELGFTAFRWWNDLGFACNLKRPMHVGKYQPPFDPDKPAVLSFYVPFFYPDRSAREQGILGRTELLGTSFGEFEARLRKLMTRLFGASGFDEQRDIAGIILNRWGHAYTLPPPGFYFGKNGMPPAHEVIRRRHGRIAFGHSELRGNQHWGPAAAEGARAVDQLHEIL